MARKKIEIKDFEPKQVLALDIATTTGYFSLNDKGGVWDFDPKKAKNSRRQYASFRNTLIRYIKKWDIVQIVAEDINVRGNFVAMRKLSEFRGILREVCESLEINPPVFVNVTSIKYFMTGRGGAKKQSIMKACKTKYNINPIDDNHADAIGVFYYFMANPKLAKK